MKPNYHGPASMQTGLLRRLIVEPVAAILRGARAFGFTSAELDRAVLAAQTAANFDYWGRPL